MSGHLRIAALLVLAAAAAASAQPLDADHFVRSANGSGQLLVVPYFSTQAANVTALNITNTDGSHGKALKIRFRGASNGDDLYNFQVFLGPNDMWTAAIYRGADGRAELHTGDRSCTRPASVNGAFSIARTAPQAVDRNGETREGFVEIINMGDIWAPSETPTAGQPGYEAWTLLEAVRFNFQENRIRCTASVLNAVTRETAPTYLAAPTGGVMANWMIVNVEKIFTFSGPAAAFEARESFVDATNTVVDRTVPGRVVFWEQNGTALSRAETEANTADLLVRGDAPVRTAVRSDLPDLSTPYLQDAVLDAKAPLRQAFALSNTIAVAEVAGEYFTLESVGAATDWVLTFPTRHYYAAVNYGPPATILYTAQVEGNYYYRPGFALPGGGFLGGRSYQICLYFAYSTSLGVSPRIFNRDGQNSPEDDIVTGGPPTPGLIPCGATSVFLINTDAAQTSATFGEVARFAFPRQFPEGWMRLGLPASGSSIGLPILGTQFTRFSNTQTNVHYGVTYPLSVLRRGYWAENGYDGPPF